MSVSINENLIINKNYNNSNKVTYYDNNSKFNNKLTSVKSDSKNENTTNDLINSNFDNNKIYEKEERRKIIKKIQEEYDFENGQPIHGVPTLDTNIMEKILDLDIANNPKYYNNDKLNINKIANDCGISLNNITTKELNSIRRELSDEGLLDKNTNYSLDLFIHRSWADNLLNNNRSLHDSITNCKFDVLTKCKYFMGLDNYGKDYYHYNMMKSIYIFFKG